MRSELSMLPGDAFCTYMYVVYVLVLVKTLHEVSADASQITLLCRT